MAIAFLKFKAAIIVTLLLLLHTGATIAMPIIDIKLPLMGAWKERFQDVNKLNAYAKTQPVELSNVKIEGKNIDGANLHGGKFENTHWKNVSAKRINLNKTTFRKGILEEVDFSDSTLTDVVFEDMMLSAVRFYGPTLNNVKFIRCTFNGSNIDRTKLSKIEIESSKIVNTSFSDGQLVAVFRNSKLIKGTESNELTSLQPPSSLTFEKSELIEVNIERSKLQSLTIQDTKFDAILDAGSAETVIIRNSTVDTSFSGATLGKVVLENNNVSRMSFNKVKAQSVSFDHCSDIRDFVLYGTTIETLTIGHSRVREFFPAVSIFGSLHITDSSINRAGFERIKAKSMLLNNVSLDGEVNFTNAQVDKLEAHNITKQPGLNLITTGSNVKF